MTERIPCTSIYIDRDSRQRKVIDTSDLEPSIAKRGVIQPIIVERSAMRLIAGERRLTASLRLGLPDIPVRFLDELNKIELQIIELEENTKRKDLTWQEQVFAMAKIHELYTLEALEEGKEWSRLATAEALGVSTSLVTMFLRVHSEFDNPTVSGASTCAQAYNFLSRKDERRLTDAMSEIGEIGQELFAKAEAKREPSIGSIDLDLEPSAPIPLRPTPVLPESILQGSFLEWAPSYEGKPFNFIHCDFPYGINVFDGNQSGRKTNNTYNDSPDVYWHLLRCFCTHRDRFMAASCHVMFWFSMEYYSETLEFFREHAPELVFQKFPLVWHKTDNVGILPDPKRGPRRVYETALIASREDRLIVSPISNTYGAPTDKLYHHSTKPEPVLRHFFQMFVDETTRLLDPTCGSGSALRAAESLGATHVLGIELDEENVKNAKTALRSFRSLRAATRK